MPTKTARWYRQRAYNILTHAMLHCEFGSEPIDRIPDNADMAAKAILLECREEVTREDIERDIIEGRT